MRNICICLYRFGTPVVEKMESVAPLPIGFFIKKSQTFAYFKKK